MLERFKAEQVPVAFVGLCGMGDNLWRGGLWEFAPMLVGKSHVSLHVEEVFKSITWATDILGAAKVVLVAQDGSGAAVLHAAVHARRLAPGLVAGVAVVGDTCCLADVVVARRHELPWQMQMYGVLKQYDLPDLLAALARRNGPATLVLSPRGASRRPLTRARAAGVYRLARRRFAAAAALARASGGRAPRKYTNT